MRQHGGDRGIARQGLIYIRLAEGDAGLAKIFADGAQNRDLTPRHAGANHQMIEAIIFGIRRSDPGKSLLKRRANARDLYFPTTLLIHRKVMHPNSAARGVARCGALLANEMDLVRPLAHDPETHIFQTRKQIR